MSFSPSEMSVCTFYVLDVWVLSVRINTFFPKSQRIELILSWAFETLPGKCMKTDEIKLSMPWTCIYRGQQCLKSTLKKLRPGFLV